MKLLLLRHAARSAIDSGDSPLSTNGHRQADELPSLSLEQGRLPKPVRLICSPKRRAQETLTPLAKALHLSITTDPRLDERHNHESQSEFHKRINAVVNEVSSATYSACVLCTHLDWLEAFDALAPTDKEVIGGWGTGEYRIFEIDGGLWTVKETGVLPGRR
jgi:broad specificity phosphatase PhoE